MKFILKHAKYSPAAIAVVGVAVLMAQMSDTTTELVMGLLAVACVVVFVLLVYGIIDSFR